MKIAVFTGNQPRHLSLIHDLAQVADKVWVVQECKTVFPGRVQDFFNNSNVMRSYFQKMIEAEQALFGDISFLPENVSSLSIRVGDLSMIDLRVFDAIMDADLFIVFGASYIKGTLGQELTDRGAINIHMGVSPFFRGASCNFWALYDGYPDLVGATIHRLSRGLDSGDMLFHALPERTATEPFLLGMKAVRSAHRALLQVIADGTLDRLEAMPQDKSDEIRYSRHDEFTDEVAEDYLKRNLTAADIGRMLENAPTRNLVNPVFI